MATRSSASTSKFSGDTKERGFTGAKSGASGDAGAAGREDRQPVRPVLKSCPHHFRCVPWGNSLNLSEPPLTFYRAGTAPTSKGCCKVSAGRSGKCSQRRGALERCSFPPAPPHSGGQTESLTRHLLRTSPCFRHWGHREDNGKASPHRERPKKEARRGTNRTPSACPVVDTRSPSQASQAIRKCE